VLCSSCGHENREGKRFCVECGSALARRCPSCSAEVDADEKFCGECGTALTGAPAATAPAPAAVRKTVTVLFADLGGSTGFGERADAEIARQVLARYHALLQATIDAHAGTVAKFMGDGMMATFGIPEVAEDDARRAVDAGADLQARFEDLAADIERRHGEALTLRVGINTGEVVIGEGDADLIGDALNVAARLEKACRPGHVLVGEETWRLTRGEVAYEELGEVTVAGRAQPVAVFEVATETATTEEVAAPFVGREPEIERLLSVLDDARAASAARLATVLGSPGVGKTRLSRELCSRADAQSVELRCDRAGEATFAPVAQLIRESAGLGDDADADAARAAIGTLLPDSLADRDRIVDVLAGLVGAAPARSVEETFWAVRRLVETTAAAQPLVVVIDDIQWAEPLLLDLIEHLAEWVGGAAVLLLGLARPELREVRPTLAEPGRPVAAVVVLDGLDASATEALAAGLLGTGRLPAGLVDRLPESTDGNPLFVRELVRMLVDDRVIRRRDDGEWELTIDAEALDVPPTIQSLLGARVERLPAAERELLELASVVGAEFSLGALRELSGDRTTAPPLLETMRRKELVEPTGTYWGDEPVYRFHHVLIRDAAYRRLLKTTRADLHERVAEWTDRTAADLIGEHEASIAFHYEQAHRYRAELGTVDARTDELARRGAELLTTAAQRALGRDDLASAGALSTRALALLPESDDAARADLLTMGCECLLASGNGAAARPLVEELGQVAVGDDRLAAWADCFAAQLVGLTDPDGIVAADANVAAAAETLTALDDGSGQAKAHQVRAGLLARLGRVGDCELELDLALAAARGADDRRRVTAVLGAAPDAALFGPSPVARAGGRCLDVVRLLRITTASPAVEAASNRCQAVLESLRGRFDVSRSMLASARASLEELGLRHGLAHTDLYAGMVERIAGDPHAAVPPLRAAFGGLGALGVGADAGTAAALLARALLVDGQVDEADQMATESEHLAGQNLQTAIGWRVARAEVLAARGDLTGAVSLAEHAVEIASGTDLIIDHADACVALANLRARAGDATGARASRTDAKRLYELKGATVPAERLDPAEVVHPPPVTEATPPRPASPADSDRNAVQNTASRVWMEVLRASEAGADDVLAELVAPGYRYESRQRLVGTGEVDEELARVLLSAARDQGHRNATADVIAVRGDRLALCPSLNRTPAGDEFSVLTVIEVDDQGRMAASVVYDDDDLGPALEELDARYAAEVPEQADLLRLVAAWVGVFEDGDVDRIRDLVAPGFVWVDHQVLGWGTVGVDEIVELFRTLREMQNAMVVTREIVSGRAILFSAENRATDAEGGEMSWFFHTVGLADDEGKTTRVEIFGEDDLDRARARLDELGRPGRGRPSLEELGTAGARNPHPENAATRATHRVVGMANAGDWDEALRAYRPDFERIDHRGVVAAPPLQRGAEEYLEGFRAYLEVFDRLAVEPIAVRGDRLALSRSVVTSAEGLESVFLHVLELDEDGLIARMAYFDEADLPAALEELDARYEAGEGVEPADPRTPAVENAATRRTRDDLDLLLAGRHDDLRASLRPTFERIDRRHGVAGAPITSAADYLASLRAIMDQFDALSFEPVAVRGERHHLSRVTWGRPDDFHVTALVVFEFDDVGLGVSNITFDEDDLAAAVAELDARYVASGEGTAAEADLLAASAAMNQRDWDAFTASLSREMVTIDHTPIGFGRADRDGFVREQMQSLVALVPDAVIVPVKLIASGEVVLVVLHTHGTTTEGSRYEWAPLLVSRRDGSGHTDRVEFFEVEDWDAALDRFDELAAESAADTRSPEVVNASTRATTRLWTATRDLRFDEVRTLLADDVERIDRRAGISAAPTHGVDEYLEVLHAAFDRSEVEEVVVTPLAVRGERLSLSHLAIRALGFEIVLAMVAELDDDGRVAFMANYDVEDLVAAQDELDDRFVAGEAAPYAPLLATVRAYVRADNDGDQETLVALCAPGMALNDHTLLGALDLQTYLPFNTELGDVDRTILVPKYLLGPGALLGSAIRRGVDENGSELLWLMHVVDEFDADARFRRADFYDAEDWDAALARFDEIVADHDRAGSTPTLDNAALRCLTDMVEHANARDVDALRAWVTPAFTVFDRRSVTPGPTTPGEEFVDAVIGTLEVFDALDLDEVVAVRGERLVVVAGRFVGQDGFDAAMLALAEADEQGRPVALVMFDEDDLGGALQALEDRYCAGEGADDAYVIRRLGDGVRARARHDWAALTEIFAPALTVTDHRLLSPGATDRDGFVRMQRELVELVPDLTLEYRTMEIRGDVGIGAVAMRGNATDGSPVAWSFWYVFRFAAEQLDLAELFDDADGVDARARFEELAAADPRTPAVDNACVRADQRHDWLLRHDTVERSMDLYARDLVQVDRRRGSLQPDLVGRDQRLEVVIGLLDVFGTDNIRDEPAAVRGDRLALYQWSVVSKTGSGFEVAGYDLRELDDNGRICRITSFDDDNLLGALEALEHRHRELSGDAMPAVERSLVDRSMAFNRGDLEPMLAGLRDDYEMVDHSPLGFGTADAAGLRAQIEAMREQLQRMVQIQAVRYASERAVLASSMHHGVTSDGTDYVWQHASVECFDGDGKVVANHSFAIEQWDEALAVFDEWSRDPSPAPAPVDPRTPTVDNDCVRVHERLVWLLAQPDDASITAGVDLLAPGIVQIDRRPGVAAPDMVGRDARLENLAAVAATFGGLDVEPLAVRGERLALMRWTITADGGFTVTGYDVNELDDDGRIGAVTTFAEDQLGDAVDLLEARHAELAGDGYPPVEHNAAEALAAWRRDDLDAFAATHAPGFTFDDRSPLGAGVLDLDTYLESLRTFAEMVPDTMPFYSRAFTCGDVALTTLTSKVQDPDGGQFEWHLAYLGRVDAAGLATHRVAFDIEQWDEALARFDEWCAADELSRSALSNRATRAQDTYCAWFAAGDWPAMGASYADDVVSDDRRSGVSSGVTVGRDQLLELVHGLVDVGFTTVANDPIAIRGERLALVRRTWHRPDGFDLPVLAVVEYDAEDRMTFNIMFDPEETAAAVYELDQRYLAGEGSEHAWIGLPGADFWRCYNERDWTRAREVLADEMEVVDHRPLSSGTTLQSAGQLIEYTRAMIELVPDLIAFDVEHPRIGRRGALSRHLAQGTSTEGAAVELETLVITEMRDGHFVRSETFAPDQLDAAIARFDEIEAGET
jgi:class 3 adenylate cyclase